MSCIFPSLSRCVNRTCEGLKLWIFVFYSYVSFCVWIVPVRDWNSILASKSPISSLVWIVPVRDWNAGKPIYLTIWNCVWIVPVRDWNVEKRGWLCVKSSCESYLWGIETFDYIIISTNHIFVWIVPVRDWNYGEIFNHEGIEKGVNRTCEGLKQFYAKICDINHILCESYLWGIETLLLCSCFVWLKSVNRTCEGLKLLKNFDSFNFLSECESYLWGIETILSVVSPVVLSVVWIVPVRDWNLIFWAMPNPEF